MIKIIMIYDQVQAGLGTKNDKMIKLGAKNILIGPGIMMERFLKENDEKIVASFYCGTGTYFENPKEISDKICKKISMLNPDIVICGPAFDYKDYAIMCAEIADKINTETSVRAIASMCEENKETILSYKEKLNIVKCPPKGGTQLNKSLSKLCTISKSLVLNNSINKEDCEFVF